MRENSKNYLKHFIRDGGRLVELAIQVKVEDALEGLRITVEEVVTVVRVVVGVQI